MTAHTLIDGSISTDPRIRRQVIVQKMAEDLVKYDAAGTEADAIRSLYATGRYAMVDIVMLIDDARQAAVQVIVAREMAGS